jgi:hypothetical protein
VFRELRVAFVPGVGAGVAAFGLLLAVAGSATRAEASPDSLRLALEDVLVGAADLAAAPVTAGVATAGNTAEVSDNGFLQGLYVLPGWLGLTFLQAGQATLRVVVGAVELIPGILLFPFPGADVPEDWNLFRQGEPLADLENPLGDDPVWLAYVLPITPFTIDVRFAPVSPWARYDVPPVPAVQGFDR